MKGFGVSIWASVSVSSMSMPSLRFLAALSFDA